jgi:hypothetical protein
MTHIQSADGSIPVSESTNRVKDTEKPAPDTYDPFAPENLKLSQEFLDQPMANPLLNTIPVERPGDQEFIQVHPTFEHTAILISHHDERNARYLVDKRFFESGGLGPIKYHQERLYLYVTRQGKLAFWPITVRKDNKENTWLESAEAARDAARNIGWICIISNQAKKKYEIYPSGGDFPDPDWEKITQGKPLNELLRIALKDRLIMDENHPLMRKLTGRE